MKQWWFGERKHIDQQKVAAKSQAKGELRRLIELGDEDAYVAYVKALNPSITKDQLIESICLFREEHQKHLHELRHHS